ncbi:MAG: hypothetical protein ABS81_04155 [Pseudonocardia sp. SCN 72-86]|nr:MAG: hypothetical protein ABS81_04155 [Pseudonocardia sp. SCN 72-86]
MSFSRDDYENKIDRIRKKLRSAGCDGMILTRPENIFYATGYRAAHIAQRTSALHPVVLPVQGEPRLLCRALEAATAKTQWTPSPVTYKDHENPFQLTADVVAASGLDGGRLGIEERFLQVHQLRELEKLLPSVTFTDVTGLVEAVAAAPLPSETECMRRAATVTSIGLTTGLREIRVGAHPYDIIGAMHQQMYAAGQSDFDIPFAGVWSGPGGGRMHDTITTEKIESGDVVTVEVMGVNGHYRSGAQACVYVGGTPPKEISEAYELVTAMYSEAKAAVRAGVTAGEVFDAANAVYRKARGDDYYRRVGGSIGLTLFTIDLVKGRTDALEPGTAFLIQTLVDDPVLLTCASTVVVTENGFEELTQPVLNLTADV